MAASAAALALAQGICSIWDLGRTIPMDLSQEVPLGKFQDLADFLDLDHTKWEQVIWDIQQSLVGLDESFSGG